MFALKLCLRMVRNHSSPFERSDSFTMKFHPSMARRPESQPLPPTNIYTMLYCGSVAVKARPKNIWELQETVKNVYFNHLKEENWSLATTKILGDGVSVISEKMGPQGDREEILKLSNKFQTIAYWAAIKCAIVEGDEKCGLKFGFVPVDCNECKANRNYLLDPNHDELSKLLEREHPPLFILVMRSPDNELRCYLFVCDSFQQAQTLSDNLFTGLRTSTVSSSAGKEDNADNISVASYETIKPSHEEDFNYEVKQVTSGEDGNESDTAVASFGSETSASSDEFIFIPPSSNPKKTASAPHRSISFSHVMESIKNKHNILPKRRPVKSNCSLVHPALNSKLKPRPANMEEFISPKTQAVDAQVFVKTPLPKSGSFFQVNYLYKDLLSDSNLSNNDLMERFHPFKNIVDSDDYSSVIDSVWPSDKSQENSDKVTSAWLTTLSSNYSSAYSSIKTSGNDSNPSSSRLATLPETSSNSTLRSNPYSVPKFTEVGECSSPASTMGPQSCITPDSAIGFSSCDRKTLSRMDSYWTHGKSQVKFNKCCSDCDSCSECSSCSCSDCSEDEQSEIMSDNKSEDIRSFLFRMDEDDQSTLGKRGQVVHQQPAKGPRKSSNPPSVVKPVPIVSYPEKRATISKGTNYIKTCDPSAVQKYRNVVSQIPLAGKNSTRLKKPSQIRGYYNNSISASKRKSYPS